LRIDQVNQRLSWRDHARAADSAAAHRDWRGYISHLQVVDSALSHRSSVTVALARGYAQLGDTGKAFSLLRDFAAAGLTRDLAADSTFSPLRGLKQWNELTAALADNGTRALPAPAVFTLGDSGFVGEDIAYDARRNRFLLSGIRGRRVVVREANGSERDFVTEGGVGSLWAVMGLGVDSARDVLWISTVADDRIPGLPAGAKPRASLLRVRLADGTLERRIEFPDDTLPYEPGDLAVAPNGDVVISDGRRGAVNIIRRGRDSLEVLVPAGMLNAPQEPAISPDDRIVVVPDYLGGIAIIPRVPSAGRASARWLHHKRSIVLNGIDGLKWSGPRTLIAVQNGVTPNRVVRLTLDSTRSEVLRTEVLAQGPDLPDPTHGIMVRGEYYVIARAGWYALDDVGQPRSGEKQLPPLVAKIQP
jgi:hypothetical protein